MSSADTAPTSSYRPDARVLACAVECDADVFVTTDKQHFIGNPLVGPLHTRCRVMTPHEALDWAQEEIRRRSQEDDGEPHG